MQMHWTTWRYVASGHQNFIPAIWRKLWKPNSKFSKIYIFPKTRWKDWFLARKRRKSEVRVGICASISLWNSVLPTSIFCHKKLLNSRETRQNEEIRWYLAHTRAGITNHQRNHRPTSRIVSLRWSKSITQDCFQYRIRRSFKVLCKITLKIAPQKYEKALIQAEALSIITFSELWEGPRSSKRHVSSKIFLASHTEFGPVSEPQNLLF